MTTITIQQHPSDSQKATLSFSHGTQYDIEIKSPFDDKQEQNLEWYFEEYLKFPFTDGVKFQQTAESIKRYGENLFRQLFNGSNAYDDYQKALAQGVELEIIGSTHFQALHWEALKNPDEVVPLAVHHTITRKPASNSKLLQVIQPQVLPTLNVLLVVARFGQKDVGYRTISQPLVELMQNSNLAVNIEILRPATYKALIQHLEATKQRYGKGYYHILHFDVHGGVLDFEGLERGKENGSYTYYVPYGRGNIEAFVGKKAFLFLNDEREPDKASPIPAEEIKNLLAQYGIPVVVLNACQSAKQLQGDTETSLGSHLMQAGIQLVVAMSYSITVSAAKLFMQHFYQKLLKHQSLAEAIRYARLELHHYKNRSAYHNKEIALEDWLLPIAYQHENFVLPLREFTQEEEAQWWEQQAQKYKPPRTNYGFVGRDLDVLRIENSLVQDNILLIQGMGGAGKTTLLHHLMNWWQVTHFVEQVFYFGYDQRTYTHQQLLHDIARQLLGEQDYERRFQSLSEVAQHEMLVRQLRASQYCLVLDNLESVTETALAIPNYLNPTQQGELKAFLHALSGGKTLVLLGSRGEEAWLEYSAEPYHLSGLDAEAASTLADKILQRHQALHYREGKHRQDLLKLLKLLAGFPLALEVVLSNLKSQTPAQVLEALQSGDENIDFESSDKTQSLLSCIEYSYNKLPKDIQKLLLCLSPFTGVLGKEFLGDYSKILKSNNLEKLPFHKWESAIIELKDKGLLTQHDKVSTYLNIHPVLPYFLNNHLKEIPSIKASIYAAFLEMYNNLCVSLISFHHSGKEKEYKGIQIIAHFEYTNLINALLLSLKEMASIEKIYMVLHFYLVEMQQDYQRFFELGKTVQEKFEIFPEELLQGTLGGEFVEVLDGIGQCYLMLRKFSDAEKIYKKELSIHLSLNTFKGENTKDLLTANIYQHLGLVAQEQYKWKEAEEYFNNALHISSKYNHKSRADALFQLGVIAQEHQRWNKAEKYFKEVLQIRIKNKDFNNEANTLYQLGLLSQKQGHVLEASNYYIRALETYEKYEVNELGQSNVYGSLGSPVEGIQITLPAFANDGRIEHNLPDPSKAVA